MCLCKPKSIAEVMLWIQDSSIELRARFDWWIDSTVIGQREKGKGLAAAPEAVSVQATVAGDPDPDLREKDGIVSAKMSVLKPNLSQRIKKRRNLLLSRENRCH